MTIDQAIKILKHEQYLDPNLETPDIIRALALGIEAAKAFKQLRRSGVLSEDDLLPGETKD